jgi:hypothetical protein
MASIRLRVGHPWLRVYRLTISIPFTQWDSVSWPTAKATLLDAVKERSKVQRAGWFN